MGHKSWCCKLVEEEGRSPILAVRTAAVKGKEENESLSVTEGGGLIPNFNKPDHTNLTSIPLHTKTICEGVPLVLPPPAPPHKLVSWTLGVP